MARIEESIQVCQGEVQRLDGIITHFLEAVRPQKPELNELQLVQLVEEVLRVQEAELRDRRIEVNVEVRTSCLRFSGTVVRSSRCSSI